MSTNFISKIYNFINNDFLSFKIIWSSKIWYNRLIRGDREDDITAGLYTGPTVMMYYHRPCSQKSDKNSSEGLRTSGDELCAVVWTISSSLTSRRLLNRRVRSDLAELSLSSAPSNILARNQSRKALPTELYDENWMNSQSRSPSYVSEVHSHRNVVLTRQNRWRRLSVSLCQRSCT